MASHIGAILRSSCEDGRRNLPLEELCKEEPYQADQEADTL